MSGYAAGLFKAQIWLIGTGGYAGGQSGDALANNAGSGAFVITDPKTAGFNFIDPTILDIQAGDRHKVNIPFAKQRFGKFQLSIADLDPNLYALASAIPVNSTANTKHTLFGMDSEAVAQVAVGMMFTQRYQGKNTGSDGPTRYFHTILPYCFASIRPSAPAFQGEAPTILDITPNATDTFINGMKFDSTGLNMGFADDRSDHMFDVTDNPLHVYTWKQGAATTFTTPYKPLSTVVTLGATPNWFTVGGVPTALSALTLAGVSTLGAAGVAGTFDVLIYETNFKT